jgi:uncharacterized protein with ParB-like and HNH nuclease domain
MGGFEKPITIKQAIDNIFSRKYLLPAIQRKFVWSHSQIEMLFDSIMRDYPINSFMSWEVTDDSVKQNFKFYEFLKEYRERFSEDNPDINTTSVDNFKAVIDGQQRLTSIYIGLRGSYAYKMPRKWWENDEDSIPTRFLYLNLKEEIKQEHDNQLLFEFKFLSSSDLSRIQEDDKRWWFKLENILQINDDNKLDEFIDSNDELFSNAFAKRTIRQLYRVVHKNELINFYTEKEQSIDKVLEIFIRTNSGGTKLSFSDLLMSIATANWKTIDARKEITAVVDFVFENIGRPSFSIDKDFVLKTCLVLLSDNIKFQMNNFGHDTVQVFEQNWVRIRKSIIEGFKLVSSFGYNNSTLRAKNAVIPIIYYIYHKGIEDDINNPIRYVDDKAVIKKWLHVSLLKSVFSGQSDNVLTGLRDTIKANLKAPLFPLKAIKDKFKSSPSKNLSFDNEYIESLLKTQKDDVQAFSILALFYPQLDYRNQDFHKDHLHPASFFESIEANDIRVPEGLYDFYKDSNNWNSILNLQLLNSHLNESKLATPLKDWCESKAIDKGSQLIPDVDLSISNFKEFIEKRKELLMRKLNSITN